MTQVYNHPVICSECKRTLTETGRLRRTGSGTYICMECLRSKHE